MVTEVTKDNIDEIIASNRVVFLKFYSDWCAPCAALAPVVEELAEKYSGKLFFGQVKANEDVQLARRYKVMGLPAIRIIKDGEVVSVLQGLKSEEELESAIEQYI
ncbi:MAG TPA: thioredoxin family protein [Pseudoneobacillus sp.]|nr:thioredoxin family protein [Pseudoneobacillus sp.]